MRTCDRCAFKYEPTLAVRFLRWFLNQTWDWVDRTSCPSTLCRGGR